MVYEVHASGELQPWPQINPCPFQKKHHNKLSQGALHFRASQKADVQDIAKAEGIHEKDMLLVFDNNKAGNNAAMSKAFTSSATGQKVAIPTAVPKTVQILYDFDSVITRRCTKKDTIMSMPEQQGTLITTSQKFQWNIVQGRSSTERLSGQIWVSLPCRTTSAQVCGD